MSKARQRGEDETFRAGRQAKEWARNAFLKYSFRDQRAFVYFVVDHFWPREPASPRAIAGWFRDWTVNGAETPINDESSFDQKRNAAIVRHKASRDAKEKVRALFKQERERFKTQLEFAKYLERTVDCGVQLEQILRWCTEFKKEFKKV